jgi:hypothetical protein
MMRGSFCRRNIRRGFALAIRVPDAFDVLLDNVVVAVVVPYGWGPNAVSVFEALFPYQ